MPANWPPQSGIQGQEWVITNFVFCLPEVAVPYSSGLNPVGTGSGTNQYVLTNGDYYVIGDMTVPNNKTLLVTGRANLYVSGNFDAKAASQILISSGSILRLFVGTKGGPPASASFGAVSNQGNVFNFQFFGLPSCTSVLLGATNGYTGTIYAPAATVVISYGGNNNFEYLGALAADAINVSGHFALHFDVHLRRVGPKR